MKRFILLLSLSVIGSFSSKAQGILSLQDAVQQSLKNNYDIILAKDVQSIDANNATLGNAGALPTVAVGAGITLTNTNSDQKLASGSETKKSNAPSDNYSYGAVLNWTFFDGFKMFATYNKLKEIEQVGDLSYQSQVEHSIQSVIANYYGLVSQKQLLIFWDTAVSLSQKQLQIAERKYNVGAGSKVDLIQAKIALNTDLSSRFAQQNQYDDSRIKFNQLLARDVKTKFEVPDSIPFEEIGDYETLHSKCIQHSPDIQIASRNLNISNYTLKEIGSQNLPHLSLTGGYNYNSAYNSAGFILLNQTSGPTGGLTLAWNIFNGNNINTAKRSQRYTIHQMEVDVAATTTQVEVDFNTAYTDYLNNKRLVQMDRDNYELAHENVTISILSFSLGTINALQMKDVQKTFEQTASDLTTARYNLLQAKTQLDRLCGILPVGK